MWIRYNAILVRMKNYEILTNKNIEKKGKKLLRNIIK